MNVWYIKKSPRPFQNYEQEIRNQLFFFEVERWRMKKATAYALGDKNVILDICALSTVAIIYAFEKLGKYTTFKHAMRSIWKTILWNGIKKNTW